jgi:hypothetical protein
MPIPTTCPTCGKGCAVADAQAGKRVVCPHCRKPFDVPAASPAEGQVQSAPPPAPRRPPPLVPPARPKPTSTRDLLPPPSVLPADAPPPVRKSSWARDNEVLIGAGVYVFIAVLGLLASVAIAGISLFFSWRAHQPEAPAVVQGEGDVTATLQALKSPDPGTRGKAAERLQKTEPSGPRKAEVAAALAERLRDSDGHVHDAAARALVTWATPETVPALLDALDNDSETVRHAAMEALGRLRDARAVQPLALRLALPSDRKHAGQALQNLGPAAEPEVVKYLHDPDEAVQIEACKVLKRVGTKASVPALQVLAQEKKKRALQVAAQDALNAINGRN